MNYELRHFDTPLIRFSVNSGAEPEIHILWHNETKKNLFPLDLSDVTEDGLISWIKHRSIPKNRAYVDNLLSTMGLSMNRPFDVIRISKGLSLNDSYWVVGEGSADRFDSCNLYDNRFSRILGEIAFTGYGSSSARISSSPEFTTNGMLPKCWRRNNGMIQLYKGGTEGASNTGNEPYSEYYAFQIAEILGVNAIRYGLSKWKGKLCSTCDLFTSKTVSYVPVGRIVRSGGMKAVKQYYEMLGGEYLKALHDMFVFDAVIFNTDRHYGNFGFLVDAETNTIIAPAPLFDHGNSLFNYAGFQALENEKAFLKYAKTEQPCVYDDFVTEAKTILTHEHKAGLRKLLNFRFVKHKRYNLPDERLKLIESAVQHRAKDLLED